MPDYSKGKIYTIRCLNDPNVYVGSTIQSLAVRMGVHRIDYEKNKILGRNKEIVKDISEWKIELYENYPCNKREELERREGEIIRLLGTLNKNIAGRNVKEYNNDKKEYIIKRQKEYFEDYPEYKEENKDIKKEYDTIYRKKNKQKKAEKDKEYQEKNIDKIKEYQKEYRSKNIDKAKEYMKEYQKEYQEKNADKIKEYKREYNKMYHSKKKNLIL